VKTIENLRAKLAVMGATLDEGAGYALNCDAPVGYVWAANGCGTITIVHATNSQSWLAKAVRAEMPALRMGLRLADADERAEIEWNNGDDVPWVAPAGSPETIPFP
jgi:hypothetical protein